MPPAQAESDRSFAAMCTMVREALFNASHSRADDEFILALARLQQSGVLIGDKYASRSFMRLCEFSGAKILEFLQAAQINSTIPGLGCLSPVSVTFDSVSVGDTSCARAETFQIVCVTFIDSRAGCLETHFVSCPSIGFDHDGGSQAACVLNALQVHAGCWTLGALRSRVLTMVGGDGAVAAGGTDMRHVSTEAANKLSAFLCAVHFFAVRHPPCFL